MVRYYYKTYIFTSVPFTRVRVPRVLIIGSKSRFSNSHVFECAPDKERGKNFARLVWKIYEYLQRVSVCWLSKQHDHKYSKISHARASYEVWRKRRTTIWHFWTEPNWVILWDRLEKRAVVDECASIKLRKTRDGVRVCVSVGLVILNIQFKS